MFNKKIFFRCLICFVVWLIGQIIILNIYLEKPYIVSRVWGIVCILAVVVINVIIGFKKDDR
ncbi:MAG: hypothetical protein LIO71_01605 [Ruminococcus sp.]|nr:hypothetical protein [Ruminococcus sp.]